ncbi:MAG: hypothetical protein H6Q59_1327 [Firmicutes bacterium]|nr:hypothetical protein [Bacillota bacterium]
MSIKNEINQASKIALIFTTITGIFTLLGKLITILPLLDDINSRRNYNNFFKVNSVWLIILLLIIICLCLYIRVFDGEFNLTFICNPMIRITAGLLIIIEGIFGLSTKVPTLIVNIQTFHQAVLMVGDKLDDMISKSLTFDALEILLFLLQTVVGLILVLYKKKNKVNIEKHI